MKRRMDRGGDLAWLEEIKRQYRPARVPFTRRFKCWFATGHLWGPRGGGGFRCVYCGKRVG